MGGGSKRKAAEQEQRNIYQQQKDLADFFMGQSKEELARRREMQKPVIDRYTRLASGDPSQIMAESAVPLGNLAKMTQQAKANIMEMAPGAARTAALGQLSREAGGQQSTLLNQAYLSAFPALQGMASETGSFGLQQAGAGYRGIEGAGATNKQLMDTYQQQKASQLGLIGSLAGAAGSMVTGGLMGGKGATGAAGKSFNPSTFQYALAGAPSIFNAVSPGAGGGMSALPQAAPIGSGFNLPTTYSGIPNASWYTSPPPTAATNPYIQIPGSPAGYGASVGPR